MFGKQLEKNVTVDRLFRQCFYTATKMILSTKLVIVQSVLLFRRVNFQASKSVAKSHSVMCVICSIFSRFMLLFFESPFSDLSSNQFFTGREDGR